MQEIISVLSFLCQYLCSTTLRQLCRVVFGMLSMTGRVTMRNISRWTPEGGSYRTVQRLFNTVFPWPVLFWAFFREHFLNVGYTYILACDECVASKSGSKT